MLAKLKHYTSEVKPRPKFGLCSVNRTRATRGVRSCRRILRSTSVQLQWWSRTVRSSSASSWPAAASSRILSCLRSSTRSTSSARNNSANRSTLVIAIYCELFGLSFYGFTYFLFYSNSWTVCLSLCLLYPSGAFRGPRLWRLSPWSLKYLHPHLAFYFPLRAVLGGLSYKPAISIVLNASYGASWRHLTNSRHLKVLSSATVASTTTWHCVIQLINITVSASVLSLTSFYILYIILRFYFIF